MKLFLCLDVPIQRSVTNVGGEEFKEIMTGVSGVFCKFPCPLLGSNNIQILREGRGTPMI